MNNKSLGKIEDAGFALHTALRKCCDSDPTSLAWNLISLEEMNDAWETYLAAVVKRSVAAKNYNIPDLKAAAADLDYGDAARNALKICFRLFSDDDWAGFGYFLTEEQD